jgi:hypothetical protein
MNADQCWRWFEKISSVQWPTGLSDRRQGQSRHSPRFEVDRKRQKFVKFEQVSIEYQRNVHDEGELRGQISVKPQLGRGPRHSSFFSPQTRCD